MVDVKQVESVDDRSSLDGCLMMDTHSTISMTSSGRRSCHYRQPPRGLGLDDNASVASFSTTKTSSSTTRNPVPSSSFLRIGHQQPAVVAATSFAAAISPTKSSASSIVSVGGRTKKSGLFNRTANRLIMSSSPTTAPLLGADPSPPKTKNKLKVGGKRRGGLVGAIRAPLRHVSKKVSALKRGKKSPSQPNHRGLDRAGSSSSSTAYSKYDTPIGSVASGEEGQERPLEAVPEASALDDSESYLELEGFLRSPSGHDLALLAAAGSTAKETSEQKEDLSLRDVLSSQGGIGAALVTCDPVPVSPLTDQAEAMEVVPGNDDGFDDIVLMPRPQDLDEGGSSSSAGLSRAPSQGSSSVLSHEDDNRIRFDEALALAMRRRSKGEADTPEAFYGSYFHFEEKGASKKKGQGKKKNKPIKVDEEEYDLRVSAHSIPSICDEGCGSDEVNASRVVIQEYSEEAADSTLAWGAMGMILGSPAPTAVPAKKKGSVVDLWQGMEDIDALAEDLADIVLATSYEHASDDDSSIPSMSLEGEDTTFNDDDSVPDIMNGLDEDVIAQTSIAENADSTLAWTALAAILGSPAPSTVVKRSTSRLGLDLWGGEEESDALPDIDEAEDAACDDQAINFDELLDAEGASHAEEQLTEHEVDSKEGADSVLAWGALGMFLGSPAPSNAVKRSTSRLGLDLWGSEEESDALPDIDEAEDVACEDQEINLDDLLDAEGAFHAEERMAEPDVNSKEGADSVLAWGALGMFLGSPAPTLVIKRSASCQSLDLWGSEEESDQLPNIIEEEKHAFDNEDPSNCQEKNNNPLPSLSETFDDDSDANSMPSLAGTSDNSDCTLGDSPLTLAGSYATSIST